ncbi:MAG TPA: glycosyltransferase 87 family protein, partial [Oryzihumus sp.]
RGWAPGELPLHLTSATVTATLWAAYLLGALAVALGLWRRTAPRLGWPLVLGLGALALLTAPFGSADHTNYAAYGRIAAQGGDPYLVPPVTWAGGHDPVTSAVEPPWTHTPSIYGPAATALQALASYVGGANLRQTVWVWQVLVVLAWLGVRWLLLRAGTGPRWQGRVDLLWTANPVVFGVVVLGAHVDVIATALALAAVLLAARHPGLAGLVLGLSVSTKVTDAVVGVAVLWSWRALGRAELVRRVLMAAAGFVVVAVPLHLWAGPHVFSQLEKARRSVSFATPWRPVLEWLTGPLGGGAARTVVTTAAVVVVVAMGLLLAVLVRAAGPAPGAADAMTASALLATLVTGTAYVLGAPYSLPWYDALTWATLPALAASALDGILLARLLVLVLAYVPGRVVAMSAAVESFSLGVRRNLAPYAGILVWLLLAGAAARAWRTGAGRPGRPGRPRSPQPPGPASPPPPQQPVRQG